MSFKCHSRPRFHGDKLRRESRFWIIRSSRMMTVVADGIASSLTLLAMTYTNLSQEAVSLNNLLQNRNAVSQD
jgi:hypothetical protein